MPDIPDLHHLADAAQRDGFEQLSVGALVRHDDKVLLLRRPALDDAIEGEWEMPSAAVDPGDSLHLALARTVTGSTGLPLGPVAQVLGPLDYPSSDERNARLLAFVLDVQASEPIELVADDAYTWTSLVHENPLVTATTKKALEIYTRSQGVHARQRINHHPPATTPEQVHPDMPRTPSTCPAAATSQE